MTVLKKLLPYLLTSLAVIGLWRLFTLTDNYAWTPKGKERLMLDFALTTISVYKTTFWLVMGNLIVFIIKSVFKGEYRRVATFTSIGLLFYSVVGQVVDKNCAFSYYIVFVNQSVTEEYLQDPIKEAGYYIGPILTEKIRDRQMKFRRYAIGGLGEIDYEPAAETLKQILYDKTEEQYFRADAYVALKKFNNSTSNETLSNFRKLATDTIDNKITNFVDY